MVIREPGLEITRTYPKRVGHGYSRLARVNLMKILESLPNSESEAIFSLVMGHTYGDLVARARNYRYLPETGRKRLFPIS